MIVEAAAGSSYALESLSSPCPVIGVLESGRSQAQRAYEANRGERERAQL